MEWFVNRMKLIFYFLFSLLIIYQRQILQINTPSLTVVMTSASLQKKKPMIDLPQIIKLNPGQDKKVTQGSNLVKKMQAKNPHCKKNPSQQQMLQSCPETKTNQTFKNSIHPKPVSIPPYHKNPSFTIQYLNLPEKMLGKSKKYYRVDAQMTIKQNEMKKDIQWLIDSLVKQKEKSDLIVLNLKENSNTGQRIFTTMNNHYSSLMQQKGRLSATLVEQVYLQNNYHLRQQIQCPISSVNQLSKTLTHNSTQASLFNLNQHTQDYLANGQLLNMEIKNFKLLLNQYIRSFRDSACLDVLNKTTYLTSNKKEVKNLSQNLSPQLTQLPRNSFFRQQKIQTDIYHQKTGNIYFKQFISLTEKSYDYLQCFLKSSFITDPSHSSFSQQNQHILQTLNQTRLQIDSMLKLIGKNAILSVLKSSYKCLQPSFNQKEIINQILLALNINPMNQFHFIKQETFIKFKKILTNQASRKQSRDFLLKYFCLQNQKISKDHFDNLLFCVLKKLIPIANQPTIEILYEKIKKITQQMILSAREKNDTSQNNKENRMKMVQKSEKIKVQSLENEKVEIKATYESFKPIKTKDYKAKLSSENYLRGQIKFILFNDPFCMWDEIIQLIFII